MFDCHKEHQPEVIGNGDEHHVVPQSWWEHMPASWILANSVVETTVQVPAGCHRNAHEIIDTFVAAGRVLPAKSRPSWAHQVAAEGYERAVQLGLTPKRTL